MMGKKREKGDDGKGKEKKAFSMFQNKYLE